MNIIIPMAGLGKRMRPHTLTTPKPLIPFAGKPMVEHLVEEIVQSVNEPIEEIAFITGHFGSEAETSLLQSAANLGAKGRIFYQEQPLGTAHAILCAADSLRGRVVVAFADTLFYCKEKLSLEGDAIIWTKKVEDPRAFGVVLTDKNQKISGFVEKPQTPVSDQAIIGIYFFKDGENLRHELQYLIDHHVVKGNEYQLTDALQNMLDKGLHFFSAQVDQWLDCGNVNATLQTHAAVLERKGNHISSSIQLSGSQIIPPCYIGDGCIIENSVIGPDVTLAEGVKISNSVICNSIVQKDSIIENAILRQSLIGQQAKVLLAPHTINISDYSQVES